MKVSLILLALIGLSAAAPQNWPYPDSLLPYRYGYPGQAGQYKYLPELEDDEDIGPYLAQPHHRKSGRQDLVVGEGKSIRSQLKKAQWRYGDKPVKPTEIPGVSVIETGSVAPVNEPGKVHAEPAPPPKVVSTPAKPVEGNKPVQPPPFPPARLPPRPTEAPKEKDEDEEEDDDSEEDDVDVDAPPPEQDDENDDEDEEDADDDPEDDDDDDRRRQEPLLKDESVQSSVAPVVVAPVVANKSVPVPEPIPDSVESNEVAHPVVVHPVVPASVDTDDYSSEEIRGPPVEALVPGYITEQGEVLVPVDTVIGDQPISIVDDPSSPPARGVALHGHGQHYDNFGSPYYYPNIYRQDDESEETDDSLPEQNDVDDSEDEDEDETLDPEAEARNEYLTSFPPSRTPELYTLIQSRIPVDSNVEYEDYQVYGNSPYSHTYKPGQNGPYTPRPFYSGQNVQRPGYNGPYSQQQAYKRPGTPNQAVSLAVSFNGNGGQRTPYPVRTQAPYPVRTQAPYPMRTQSPYPMRTQSPYPMRTQSPYPVRTQAPFHPFAMKQNGGYYGSQGFGGYNKYQGPYDLSQFRPSYNNQYQHYRRPVYPQRPYGGYSSPQYNPFTAYSRPQGSEEEFSKVSGPQINNRIVIHGGPQGYGQYGPRPIPVKLAGNKGTFVGFRRPAQKPGQVVKVQKQKVKNSNKRKPTPVIKQDDEYIYEPVILDDSSVDSSSLPDSYEPEISRKTSQVTTKSRRIPKMAKKPKTNKKVVEQKKSNSDPLNILKKINSKSRRN